LTNSRQWDVFWAKYDGTGEHLFSEAYGSAGLEEADAVSIDGTGIPIPSMPPGTTTPRR